MRLIIAVIVSGHAPGVVAQEQKPQEDSVKLTVRDNTLANRLRNFQIPEGPSEGQFVIPKTTLEFLKERGLINHEVESSGGQDTIGGF